MGVPMLTQCVFLDKKSKFTPVGVWPLDGEKTNGMRRTSTRPCCSKCIFPRWSTTHVNVLSVTTDLGTDFSFTQASCVLAVTQVILAQEMEDPHLYVPPLQGLTNMFRQE